VLTAEAAASAGDDSNAIVESTHVRPFLPAFARSLLTPQLRRSSARAGGLRIVTDPVRS
jgi:hypothetical protein